MQFTTTISSKGQIVVPKQIRDKLNLKASDTLNISIEDNAIIARPALTLDEAFGMFKVRKPISKKDIKEAFRKHVEKKFQ